MDSSFMENTWKDEVCDSCGQIFSARAALLEHRARKSCYTNPISANDSVEVKRLKCDIDGCTHTFATQSGLGKHRVKVHGCRKRTQKSKLTSSDDRSTQTLSEPIEAKQAANLLSFAKCPIWDCTFMSNKKDINNQKIDLWMHLSRKHPGSGVDVIGGPFKCSVELCGWSGFAQSDLLFHINSYHLGQSKKSNLNECFGTVNEVSSATSANRRFLPESDIADKRGRKSRFEDEYDRICSVLGCPISQKMLKPDGTAYEFFSFPKNASRLARWTRVANPRFPDFRPKTTDAICERHFRKRDLLCAKPGLMDGADPHRDESLSDDDAQDDSLPDHNNFVPKFEKYFVKNNALYGSDHTAASADSPNNDLFKSFEGNATSNTKYFDEIEDDEDKDTVRTCCGSEIPVMKGRVRRMEKQCDSLFLMIRGLLQAAHAEQLASGTSPASEFWRKRQSVNWERENHSEIGSTDGLQEFEARQINLLRAASARYAQRFAANSSRESINVDGIEKGPGLKENTDKASAVDGKKMSAERNGASVKQEIIDIKKEEIEQDVLFAGTSGTPQDDDAVRVDVRVLKRRATRKRSRGPGEPRVDEDNLVLLHPNEDRVLEQDEIFYYLGRVILMMQTERITKSRVRMLGPDWVHLLDDSDINGAIAELKSIGLLTADRSKHHNNVKTFIWVNPTDIEDFETWMAYYRIPEYLYKNRFME